MPDAFRPGAPRRETGHRAGPHAPRHRRPTRRRSLVAAGAGTALAASVAVAGTSLVNANATIEATSACSADYSVRHQWKNGFSGQVTVTNTGDEPVDPWALRWSFSEGQEVIKGWNGAWETHDDAITVRADDTNHVLQPGKSITVRFIASHRKGDNTQPSGFSLNGVECHIDTPVEPPTDARPSETVAPSGAAAAPRPSPSKSGGTSTGPLGPLYVDPSGQVLEWVASNIGDFRASVIRSRIARQPQARWFTEYNPDSIASQVRSYTSGAASAGKTPVMVAYSMTHRDCGGASAGGAPDADGYRTWIRNLASGIGSRKAIVILEPDALPHLRDCLDGGQQQERLELLSYAGKVLNESAPNARIYYDTGHSRWIDSGQAASWLRQAGATQYGDGIALNTSNYNTTSAEVSYGKRILAALGVDRFQMVVDTSRNGAGPAGSEWCDPAGRKLGRNPTTATGDPKVAAYLWVKRPGESDGCSGAAGQFIPETAYELSS